MVVGGAGNVGVTGIDLVPGLLTNNITLAQNMLLFLPDPCRKRDPAI